MNGSEATRADRLELRYVVVGAAVVVAMLAAQGLAGLIREAVTNEPSTLELVQTCLTERSRPFESAIGDPIATSAGRGALVTEIEGNRVTVALGSSESDARRIYEAYVAVAPDDVVATRLEQNRKAVFLWERPPTTAEHDFMVLCTLDAQQ